MVRDITREMQILFYLVFKLFLMENILSGFSDRNCGEN